MSEAAVVTIGLWVIVIAFVVVGVMSTTGEY
jgi:hypothetical protein